MRPGRTILGLAATALLALLPVLAGTPALRANPEPLLVELDGPEVAEGVSLVDVDGDGAREVFLLDRRSLWGFDAAAGALPASGPRWHVDLPADVSFVDPAPAAAGQPPTLVLLARHDVRTLELGEGPEKAAALPGAAGLGWSNWRQASFADLVLSDGTLLLPTLRGWHCRPPAAGGVEPFDVAIPWFREVEPAGDFLEDVGVVTEALPALVVGPPPEGAPTGSAPVVWTFSGTDLLAAWKGAARRQDYAFLPVNGIQRLVDLDGDGAPEVVHQEGTNQETTLAVFATPPPRLVPGSGVLAPAPRDPRPAVAVLRLTGYVLDPAFPDLDGDGHRDLVVTTIPIDARNTLRALAGNVTASTRAFLYRTGAGRGVYPGTPDAEVVSDIGVAIRFSAAGNIQIARSFTILVDGDYDGDGRKDLAIRTGPDQMTIRRGVAAGVWERAGRVVKIPPMGGSQEVRGWPADLDGDGRDEMLLVYAQAPGGRDRVFVLRP